MAEQRELPSDSDASDVDFKPSDEESLPSEEDSDGCVEEAPIESEDQANTKIGKRRKKQINKRKKIKKKDVDSDDNNDVEDSKDTTKLSAEEEKKRADSLWEEFMNDCPLPARKTPANSEVPKESQQIEEAKSSPVKSTVIEKENKALVTEVYEFAGEKVTVQKEVPAQHPSRGRGRIPMTRGRGRGRGGGGIAALIGQLGKKNKLSTLEKSKLDWENFKKNEGIEEDLEKHNKGKEGYLEKQDFLQRTDLRQFEIEKQLRTTSRSNR